MTEPKKRPRGRPRLYEPGTSKDNEGAPKLNVRFDPVLYEHVCSRPEGPRAYLERVVAEDIERAGHAAEQNLSDVLQQQSKNTRVEK